MSIPPKRTRKRRQPRSETSRTTGGKTPTVTDRVLLETRKFIAAAIFFNSQAAEKISLGLTDLQLIHVIQLYGPSTPSRLAAWTGLSSGGITVALDRLTQSGYLQRQPNPADRRSSLVSIVPDGLERLLPMYKNIEQKTRSALKALSVEDLEAVLRFFDALHNV